MLAMVDGERTNAPMISVTDDGLLRGDGAFEVLRLYDGVPFARGAHLERLARTAAGLRLECDLAAIGADIDVLVRCGELKSALLRVVLTRAGRRILVLERVPEARPAASLACVAWDVNPVTAGLKTLSYAANALAARLAAERGADLALLVASDGEVLEGPNYSVFFRLSDDSRLTTPPLGSGILDSITRRQLIRSVEVNERRVFTRELANVREAFVASTVREILPINAIDGHRVPEVAGPSTASAIAAYGQSVQRYSASHPITTRSPK